MRHINFQNDHFYHVYNRGVEKRNIFLDHHDYCSFQNRLIKCNDPKNEHKKYVDVVAFCLMPNHFHLLLRQNIQNGISKYMSRIANGFTKFFNKRHNRSGRLFGTPYQAKFVDNDRYLIYLSAYIHLNLLSNIRNKTKDTPLLKSAIHTDLKQYPWSSYRDYTGRACHDFVNPHPVLRFFDSGKDYLTYLKSVSMLPKNKVGKLNL